MTSPRRLALLLLPLLAACPPPDQGPVRTPSDGRLVFDPELSGSWFDFPFPSDLRRTDEGNPDWRGLPNPGGSALVEQYLEFGSTQLDGFGLNAPSWFLFDRPVHLPPFTTDAADAAGRCEGPVRIVDVDPESPQRGSCLPARWFVVDELTEDDFTEPNTVAVAPYWGFPMRGATTYAVVLVDVLDDAGDTLQPSEQLASLVRGRANGELQAVYQPLADLVAEQPEILGAEDGAWLAAATVFTTQDVLSDMRALTRFVTEDPEYPRWTGELELVPEDDEHHNGLYDTWDGTYLAHNFQRGDVPYADEGGGFVWQDGEPVPQTMETMPFAIGMPQSGFDQPEAGWPVVIHSHGTGGDRWSHFGGGGFVPTELFARRGFLSIGIPQPIHGDRWPEGNPLQISLYSFNYFNPEAGMTTFRQAAVDTLVLVEFLKRELTDGALAQAHPDLRIDPERIYYFGHSQGGITGAIAAPFVDDIAAWTLSGAGGGLSMTILQRQDPTSISDLLLTAVAADEDTELYDTHPLVAMVQALAEKTDPINYAPAWFAEPEGQPTSVLLTEGILDAQTPADTSEALAVAGRLPLALPHRERAVPGLQLRGLQALDTPYRGNADTASGPVSSALAQFDANHFAVFYERSAADVYANFLWSAVRDDDIPEVGGGFP